MALHMNKLSMILNTRPSRWWLSHWCKSDRLGQGHVFSIFFLSFNSHKQNDNHWIYTLIACLQLVTCKIWCRFIEVTTIKDMAHSLIRGKSLLERSGRILNIWFLMSNLVKLCKGKYACLPSTVNISLLTPLKTVGISVLCQQSL